MKGMFLLLLIPVFTTSCDLLNKEDGVVPVQTVQDYSARIADLHDALENFVLKDQAFENAQFSTLKSIQSKQIVGDYLDAGSTLVGVMQKIQIIQNQTKSLQLKSGSTPTPCGLKDFIPDAEAGISGGLIKNMSSLLAETKNASDALQLKFSKGEINENAFNVACDNLKIANTVKNVNTGIRAVLSTGNTMSTGLIVNTITLPAIATLVVPGVETGTSITWIASWNVVTNAGSGVTQQYIVGGTATVGGKLPIYLIGQGATVTLSIEGYAPVVIYNFEVPPAAYDKKINITPVKLSNAKSGGSCEVCLLDEPMSQASCNEIQFTTGSPFPANPAPGQGVTVTATIIPKVANCSISFSIIGTDGYKDSATKTTNSDGQAAFFIPGGASGVFDKVSITSVNGKSYVVSYTF